jgi:hypothetical protein
VKYSQIKKLSLTQVIKIKGGASSFRVKVQTPLKNYRNICIKTGELD